MLPSANIFSSGTSITGLAQDVSTRALNTVSLGNQAGAVSSGTQNTFIGVQAGATNSTGSYVTAVGYQASSQNTNSSYVTTIGAFAGSQNLSGNEVTFVGFRSGELNRYGNQHVGIGAFSLQQNISGNASVAVGYKAGQRTLDGGYNTIIGAYAGQDNRSGNFNTMAGYSSGRASFLGDENTYFGALAGYSNSHGSANSFMGYRSGYQLTNGDYNIAIGAYSMESVKNGYSNVAIGSFSSRNQTGNSVNNVVIGANVAADGELNESVVIGSSAAPHLKTNNSVVIGYNSASTATIGNCNILIGTGADLFSECNNLAIAIGSVQTLTYTNSISIGNTIINERESSIAVGNVLKSDAPQSIILGNNISLQSVIFYKDLLYQGYITNALNDGQRIFGICNINYTNSLVNPFDNTYYDNATMSVVIDPTKTINSMTNPPLNNIGTSSYNLLDYVNTEYAITNGHVYTIKYTSNLNQNISSSDLYILSSSPYSLSNFPLIRTLNSYKYTHELNPIFNLSTPSITNITESNQLSLISPIYIVKRQTPPIILYSQSNNYTINTSILQSQSPLSINTNWSLIKNNNLGIDLSCNISYIVSKFPKFGELNNSIYDSTNINSLLYTSYSEFSGNTQDSFEITPIFSITDSLNSNYGIPSSNTYKFNINYKPLKHEIYYGNQITIPQFSSYTLKSSDIYSLSIPSLNNDIYTNVYNIPSSFVILSNQVQFTSNMIAIMKKENIANYPPSKQFDNFNTISSTINLVYEYNYNDANNNIYPNLNSIKTNTISLSNFLLNSNYNINTKSQNLNDLTTIYNTSVLLSNYVPIANNTTTNIYRLLNSEIVSWSNSHYYYPQSSVIKTSLDSFSTYYYNNNFYNFWSNINTINSLFNPNNPTISSNIITNTYSQFTSLTSFGISGVSSAITIYPNYSLLYHKYFEVPRLFITTSNLNNGIIQLQNISTNLVSDSINFVIETSNIIIPLTTYSNMTIITDYLEYNNIILSTQDTLLYSSQLLPYKISNAFIHTPPISGILTGSTTFTTHPTNLSNISYSIINPWISSDKFKLSLISNSNSLTTNYNYYYDNTIRVLPININSAPTTLSDVVQSNIYTSQTILSIASNIDIINSQIIYTPVFPYNSNIGCYTATSNITIYNSSNYINNTSNLYTFYYYKNYSLSNYINNYYNQFSTLTTNQYYLYNQNGISSSNYIQWTSNIITNKIQTVNGNNSLLITAYQKHYDHYDYMTNEYIYHSDDNIITIQPSLINQTPINNQEGPYITNINTNILLSQSYNQYDSYIKLSKNYIYSPNATLYNINAPSSNIFKFISSNIGPVNKWNVNDIIYVLGINSSCNTNIQISSDLGYSNILSVNSIPSEIPKYPLYNNIINLNIPSDTMSVSINSIINNDRISFIPTHINFINNGNNVITNQNRIVTQSKLTDTIIYKSIGKYPNDILTYFYSSNQVYSSSNYTKELHLVQSPSPNGQSFNTGLTTIKNTLNPLLFYHSLSNIQKENIGINILSKPNGITITPSQFRLIDTSNSIITANTDALNQTGRIVYNLVFLENSLSQYNISPIINNNLSFNINTYFSYEYSLSSNTNLILENIGENNQNNLTQGALWDNINLFQIQGNIIDYNKLQLITTDPLNNGFLWKNNYIAENVISYNDIIQGNLFYIPFNPLQNIMSLSNDVMNVRLLYNKYISPEYTINLKNYISRFTPRGFNASSLCNVILPPVISGGLISDNINYTNINDNTVKGYTSNINTNINWLINNNIYNESINIYNISYLPTNINSNIQLTFSIDEADSIQMSTILNNIISNTNHVYYYITQIPSNGIIQDTRSGNSIVKFSELDLQYIVYQHTGKNLDSDYITIGISSTPYDISLNEIIVNININEMPYIISNKTQYTYLNTSNEIYNSYINVNSLIFNNTTNGYIHILGKSNLIITDTSSNTTNLIPINNSFNYKLNTIYDTIGFDFSYNNHSTGPYVNRLANNPLYSSIFKNHYDIQLNKHIDNNTIAVNIEELQKIKYTLIENPSLFNNNTISLLFQILPKPSLINPQFEFFNNYKYNINYYTNLGLVLSITFTKYTWNVNGIIGNLPINNLLDENNYNTILVVNNDHANKGNLSIYWKYQILDTNNINLLSDITIPSIDLTNLTSFEISVPVYDNNNYISSSNFVKKVDNGDVNASYSLNNYYVKYSFVNFEFYVGNINTSIDTNAHNIIVGQVVNVRGINNICIGNQFNTSGDNSIIIGNSIGVTSTTAINEVFKSIIIGSDSFAESTVQNIIAIGNSNLNYLKENASVSDVNTFLSQNPILIGNGINIDKLDYNINIGNTFLKTSKNGNQIYLGLNGEKVGIGYSSNIALQDQLSVNGNITANTITVKSFNLDNLIDTIPTITCISSTNILANYLVSATGNYTTDIVGLPIVRLSTQTDFSIVGICIESLEYDVNTYKVKVGVSGHIKVWCTGVVTVGDFMGSLNDGTAVSLGHQVITQNSTVTSSGQQTIQVRKVVNGVPIFTNDLATQTITTNASSTPLISSYTFGKSLMTWDGVSQNIPWINTKIIRGKIYGLIGCLIV